jgi:ADP-heptose:LPS heptosyltransferase
MKLTFGRPAKTPAIEGGTVKAIARDMVVRADRARDGGMFRDAAFLYGEASRLFPHRADLIVQQANMLKEAGDLAGAARAYGEAVKLTPRDADLHLQFGHLYKSQGRILRAAASYRRALKLKPNWPAPQAELAALRRLTTLDGTSALTQAIAAPGIMRSVESQSIAASRELRMAAPLMPGPPLNGLHGHGEEIAMRMFGKAERTPWGIYNVLRGVQAFRGVVISTRPVVSIEIHLNGLLIHRGGLAGGFVIPHERDNPDIRKYTFNAWIDVTPFAEGRYDVHFRAHDISGRSFERTESVVIAGRLGASPLPDSDTDVPPADLSDPRSLDEQINSRPSMIRLARRAFLNEAPRTILVQRPDVLGDLVVAVPALKRLRGLFPDARIVGLLSPANVDLARTLGIFDEIVLTSLVFNPWERRRVVSPEALEKLATDLDRFEIDLAIDLCTSVETRLLIPLSKAPVSVGFTAHGELPQLSIYVDGHTKDPWNGHETVPHGNMAMALIEWMNALMRSEPTQLRRAELNRASLTVFGLPQNARFVVLHSGGRWEFSRWPHYLELARLLLAQTDVHVILMTTDATLEMNLPPDLGSDARFQVLSKRLAFDELDALVSFSAVFIGDDSGVKHLASLRGSNVIGIHNARNNWSEWGHDGAGYMATRKVPCAGCMIQNYPDSDDCGRAFVCITAIHPDEIFEAAQTLLRKPASPGQTAT